MKFLNNIKITEDNIKFEHDKRYTLYVAKWYGKRGHCKACRVFIGAGQYNMALHPKYVYIQSVKIIKVWGSWIEMTINKAKKNNKKYQENLYRKK